MIRIIGIVIIIFIVYILIMIITDYRPDDITELNIQKNDNSKYIKIKQREVLTAITYNIGYCGIDKDQDVFIDGGTGSGSESKERTVKNLHGITNFLEGENFSFILLQEVDTKSKRSFNVNQYTYLSKHLGYYNKTFALNYKVFWIPYPIFKPYGYVNSGISTFSKYTIKSSIRYQYPGKESLLKRLWFLDRCFIVTRMCVENEKELVLINSHCSAYDKSGKMKRKQMDFLKEFIKNEYNKGNYVIAGGDWNQLIPGTNLERFGMKEPMPKWLKLVPSEFLPEGFTWVSDFSIPSNRSDNAPYESRKNYLSVIDGFLVSDNVEIKTVKTYSLGFKYTDHNPVKIEFILK